MDFVGRGQSAELMRGGEVCQLGLVCVNGVANGRKRFSEKVFPWPPAGVANRLPEDRCPTRGQKAGFSQTLGARAQKVLFHGQ